MKIVVTKLTPGVTILGDVTLRMGRNIYPLDLWQRTERTSAFAVKIHKMLADNKLVIGAIFADQNDPPEVKTDPVQIMRRHPLDGYIEIDLSVK